MKGLGVARAGTAAFLREGIRRQQAPPRSLTETALLGHPQVLQPHEQNQLTDPQWEMT